MKNKEKNFKVLYLDINAKYIAPTRNLLPILLKKIFDVTFFGPGYVSDKTILLGVEKFIEKEQNFDFIITNEHILFNSQKQNNKTQNLNAYKNNYVLKFNTELLQFSLNDMYTFFKKTKIDKLSFILETDYYCLDKYILDEAFNTNSFFITEGRQFIKSKFEMEYLSSEKFQNRTNDYWFDFVNSNNNKIISLSQFMDETEFSFNHFSNKKNLVDVPGINYFLRKKAIDNLRSNKISLPSKKYMVLYSLYSKIFGSPFSNYQLLKIYNNIFRENIENSRYAFTCGSATAIPIRKFYEIPALGTFLLCAPCTGFSELGFEDGINCKTIDPSYLCQAIVDLESDLDLTILIAERGRELVWDKHSVYARAQQLLTACFAIKNRIFNGTYWSKGTFKLDNK
jgi:hypothetical protein